MKILALDLGAYLGWAYGDVAAHPPRVGVERLAHKETVRYRCGALGLWLHGFVMQNTVDKIAVENFLQPAASFSGDATIGQILLHGAVHTIAGMHSIDVVSVEVSTSRVHFCGRASAMPAIRGVPRTSAQKAAARKATKEMVIARARLLGYMDGVALPFECQCAMADASCVWDWAKVHIGRTAPRDLHLFA